MEDIAPGLLDAIREEFTHRIQRNRKILTLYDAIQNGTAAYQDVGVYAYEIGDALSRALHNHLSSAVLPDGRMYFNIADRVLRPLLEENQGLISDAALRVQTDLNKKASIGLKAQPAQINDDRIAGIVDKVSDADNFDDVAWVLDEPVKTFSQSVVDQTLKANVDFQGRAGLRPKVIRKATRKCCDWCQALAGEYEYPDVPDDVYRRHQNCRCTVEYDPGDGKRQNVHTKQWTTPSNHGKIKTNNKDSKQRNRFSSVGDPMAEVTGPAELSNPTELRAFLDEIKSSGVELIRHEKESLGYCPGFFPGQPGQISVSANASYSAWCHEMQHLRDDRAAGWQGMRIMADKDLCVERERRAYDVEIKLAIEAGREDIADRLRANFEQERRRIYGNG